MKIHELRATQRLPITLDEAWRFFSTPANLAKITPASMKFRIANDVPGRMYPGAIVIYRIAVFPGINATWVTEITHLEEPYYFVDEQRFGPYRFWHHKHFLREVAGGVEMEDLVHYALPLGALGAMAHPLVVRRRLRYIFDFRRRALAERFGKLEE